MIFEGLGALGSDVGVQGRFLVKNLVVIRQIPHSFGGQFSMFFGIAQPLGSPLIEDPWTNSDVQPPCSLNLNLSNLQD